MDFLERQRMVLGSDLCEQLHHTTVAVVGLGGVGSAAAEALCRAGIGRIILLDCDKVATSNINRQLIATTKTIGMEKTAAAALRLAEINPACSLVELNIRYDADTREQLFVYRPDAVIDCIDTVTSKLDLIEQCVMRKTPIYSAMGTGNKIHPEQLMLCDLQKTTVCPLCRVMRRELSKRGIRSLPVVFSAEQPITPQGGVITEQGRHIPGSVSFVPPVAGFLLAGAAIRDLCDLNNTPNKEETT